MKTTLFTFLALAFLLSSCSDEPLSESIVGTWELVSVESTGCDDPDENIPYIEVDDSNCIVVNDESVCNVFYTFAADETATQTITEDGDTDVDDYTYTVNDDNNTILLCDSPNNCETVRVEDDEFTLTFIDDGCTTNVVYKKS